MPGMTMVGSEVTGRKRSLVDEATSCSELWVKVILTAIKDYDYLIECQEKPKLTHTETKKLSAIFDLPHPTRFFRDDYQWFHTVCDYAGIGYDERKILIAKYG